MSVLESLISKVSQLTALVTQIVNNALKTGDLPSATTPLTGSELVRVVQGGESKQVNASDLGGGGSGGPTPYGSWRIWKASGNSSDSLEAGDMVEGWWNTTTFWNLARYNGGTITLIGSYTVLTSTEDL
jgi:hypothetical protein